MPSDIQFDTDSTPTPQYRSVMNREILGTHKRPPMIDWLMKKGVVKDEKAGMVVLMVVSLLLLLLSCAFFFDWFGISGSQGTPRDFDDLPPAIREALGR